MDNKFNMEKVWTVESQGVYQQGTYSIEASLEDARVSVKMALAKEEDNYHHFSIRSYEIGKVGYPGELIEIFHQP